MLDEELLPGLDAVAVIGCGVAAVPESGADPARGWAAAPVRRGRPRLSSPPARHVVEGEHLRSAEVVGPPDGLPGDQVGDPAGDLAGRDRLEQEVERQGSDRDTLDRVQQPGDQLVELSGPQDGVGNAVNPQQLLARQLLAVVAVRDLVDADDRDVEQMAGARAGVQQMPRLHRIGPAEVARVGRGMDDQVGARGGGQDASAGGQVPGVGTSARVTGQRSDLVAPFLQDRNELATQRSRAARDQDDAHGGQRRADTVVASRYISSTGPTSCSGTSSGSPRTSTGRAGRWRPSGGFCPRCSGLLADGATHVGVATDHVIESFRNDMWPGYKTSAGVDPTLLGQFDLLEVALYAMGVTVWPMVTLEADDALASAAAVAAADPAVERVVICTPDKDLGQCVVGSRVVQMDRRKGVVIDEAGVRAKFGVGPASIPDYLALVGDSADGFPGLPGWGAKTTAAVLARYEHLEAIPDQPGQWDVPIRGVAGLAVTLAAQRDLAMLFRDLATLRTSPPAMDSVEALRWAGPRARVRGRCAPTSSTPPIWPNGPSKSGLVGSAGRRSPPSAWWRPGHLRPSRQRPRRHRTSPAAAAPEPGPAVRGSGPGSPRPPPATPGAG